MHLISLDDHQLSILRKLKETLSCSLCSNLQSDPSYLSCGHSFCGVCLAESFVKMNACPECGIPVQPCDAIRFHAMGGVVSAYIRFNNFCERNSAATYHGETAANVEAVKEDEVIVHVDVPGAPTAQDPIIKDPEGACTAGDASPNPLVAVQHLSTLTTAEPTGIAPSPPSLPRANSASSEPEHADSMIVLAAATCVESAEDSLLLPEQHLRSPGGKARLVLDSLNPDGSEAVNVPASPRSSESQGVQRSGYGERVFIVDNTCDEDLFYSVPEQEFAPPRSILSASEGDLVARTSKFATEIENTLNNSSNGQLWTMRNPDSVRKRTHDQLEEVPGWRCKLI